MAIEDQRLRLRRSFEEKLGVEEAAYLMDRPAGGWSDLVTNQTLDLKLEALELKLEALEQRLRVEFRDQTTHLVRWIVPTIFAGMAAASGIVAAAAAFTT